MRSAIVEDGTVSQETLVKITSVLGNNDGSLCERLSARLHEHIESTASAIDFDGREDAVEPYLQLVDAELAKIKELKNQIQAEEAMSDAAAMDSLAIPVGEAGNNLRRYEAAIRRHLSSDRKELDELQKSRLKKAVGNPSRHDVEVASSVNRPPQSA